MNVLTAYTTSHKQHRRIWLTAEFDHFVMVTNVAPDRCRVWFPQFKPGSQTSEGAGKADRKQRANVKLRLCL
jgi:hypothetical protein